MPVCGRTVSGEVEIGDYPCLHLLAVDAVVEKLSFWLGVRVLSRVSGD